MRSLYLSSNWLCTAYKLPQFVYWAWCSMVCNFPRVCCVGQGNPWLSIVLTSIEMPSLSRVGAWAPCITHAKARYLKTVSMLSWESPWLANKKPWVQWLGNICISLCFATWNSCQSGSPRWQLSENWWSFLQFPFMRSFRCLSWKPGLGPSRWHW